MRVHLGGIIVSALYKSGPEELLSGERGCISPNMLHCAAMKSMRFKSKLLQCLCRYFFRYASAVAASVLALSATPLQAAAIEFRVTDAAGAPVENVAVYATPRSVMTLPKTRKEAVVEQVRRQFAPLVSVIQTGASVQFPNRDDVRHHVYSFSPAKTFEIKLYVGTPVKPVAFDKPGDVVLGCNIHDHMRAFVFVVDTPFVAKTDAAGRAVVEDLPAGDFEIGIWHFAQAAAVPTRRLQVRAEQGAPVPAAFALTLRAAQGAQR